MAKLFGEFLVAVIVFVATNTLLGSTILTGTDVGTTLLTALAGLIMAALALFILLKGFQSQGT